MLKQINTDAIEFRTPSGQSNNVEILKTLVKKITDTMPKSVRVKEYAEFKQKTDITTRNFLQQFQIKYDCGKIDELSVDQKKH